MQPRKFSLYTQENPTSIQGFPHFFIYIDGILPSPPTDGDLHQIMLRAPLSRKRLERFFSSQFQWLRNRSQGKWLLLCRWANYNLPCSFKMVGLVVFNCVTQELNSWGERLPVATGIRCQSVLVIVVLVFLVISPFAIWVFRRASSRFWCGFERVYKCVLNRAFFNEKFCGSQRKWRF